MYCPRQIALIAAKAMMELIRDMIPPEKRLETFRTIRAVTEEALDYAEEVYQSEHPKRLPYPLDPTPN